MVSSKRILLFYILIKRDHPILVYRLVIVKLIFDYCLACVSWLTRFAFRHCDSNENN